MDEMSRGDLKAVGWTVAVIAVIALVAAVFLFSPGRAAARAHGAGLERWAEREPTAYAFDYSSCSGMCAGCTMHVTVRDGEVVDTDRGRGCGRSDAAGPSIEDLFRSAEDARPSLFGGDQVVISYDPAWGFPSSVVVTCGDHSADCGSSWSVSHFTELTADGQVTSPST
jgi:hypothetical protein